MDPGLEPSRWHAAPHRTKSRWATITRRAGVSLYGAARLARWMLEPGRYPTAQLHAGWPALRHLVYSQVVPLRRADEGADRLLEEGKVVNVRLAAPAFHGLAVSPDRPLSFWRTLGRVTSARGYRLGMELQGGCVVPSLGGGLCLISNSLFEMAAKLGWRILERHGHTVDAVPRPEATWGLDATVLWPYVDLCVAPREGPVQLEMEADDRALRLRVFSDRPSDLVTRLSAIDDHLETTPQGQFRSNRMLRRVTHAPSGELVEEAVIATNRRQLLHPHEIGRNCLNCGEASCHSRVLAPALPVSD